MSPHWVRSFKGQLKRDWLLSMVLNPPSSCQIGICRVESGLHLLHTAVIRLNIGAEAYYVS